MQEDQIKQAIMVKEIFEERKTSLEITLEHFKTLKEVARSEKNKLKYDILVAECELSLEFVKDRLEKTTKVLDIHSRITSDDISFAEKMECVLEMIEIISDL